MSNTGCLTYVFMSNRETKTFLVYWTIPSFQTKVSIYFKWMRNKLLNAFENLGICPNEFDTFEIFSTMKYIQFVRACKVLRVFQFKSLFHHKKNILFHHHNPWQRFYLKFRCDTILFAYKYGLCFRATFHGNLSC